MANESSTALNTGAGSPRLVLISGPNGAGKSTAAYDLLRGALMVPEFVNADTIAHGLSAFEPAKSAMSAGRIMLDRLQNLAAARQDFAFETTLASRTFAPRVRRLRQSGYRFLLVFLFLPDSDVAVARVRERVRLGGHDVPEQTIRRRYVRGLQNFFRLYKPMADACWFYDSSALAGPQLVALSSAESPGEEVVEQTELWKAIRKEYE